jgi:class 3 adenylate cyclase
MPGRKSIMQRKLTVIVSADVIGYTAMMERNQAATLQRLMANRKTVGEMTAASACLIPRAAQRMVVACGERECASRQSVSSNIDRRPTTGGTR